MPGLLFATQYPENTVNDCEGKDIELVATIVISRDSSLSGIWKSALMLAIGHQRRDRVHFAFVSLFDLGRNSQSTELSEWYARYSTNEPNRE